MADSARQCSGNELVDSRRDLHFRGQRKLEVREVGGLTAAAHVEHRARRMQRADAEQRSDAVTHGTPPGVGSSCAPAEWRCADGDGQKSRECAAR